MRPAIAALSAALLAGTAAAKEPPSPEAVLELFETVCLASGPAFERAEEELDRRGFPRFDSIDHRPHPGLEISATVTARPNLPRGTCLVSANALSYTDIARGLTALTEARFGSTAERQPRGEDWVPGAEWAVNANGHTLRVGGVQAGEGVILVASFDKTGGQK